MSPWIEIAVVIGGGVVSVAFATWRLDRLIKHMTGALDEQTAAQDKRIALMCVELESTRAEVLLLGCELSAVRLEVECMTEGRPAPQRPRAPLS